MDSSESPEVSTCLSVLVLVRVHTTIYHTETLLMVLCFMNRLLDRSHRKM